MRYTERTSIGTPHFTMDEKIRKDNIARSAFYQAVCVRLAELEDKIESGELVEVVRCKDCKYVVCRDCFLYCALDEEEKDVDTFYYCPYGTKK